MMDQSAREGARVKSDALHGGRELGGRGLMHQILYWRQPHLYVYSGLHKCWHFAMFGRGR